MSKNRWLLYSIFGLVFYLIFLVIELPASWFAWGLNRYTQGAVRLDPIAGSLWGGNGRLVIYYPTTTPHDFGQAEWGINPLWLLTGRVQLSLQTSNQDRQIKTTIGIARNSFTLKDTDIALPASFVAQLYAPLSLISPQGKVRISAEGLTLSPDRVEGTATLEWLNAGSSLSNVQPLGDYRLDITGAEMNANLKLTTLRGDLEFTGQGQWQPQTGQVQITGSATPRARADELDSLLKMIGTDQGGGKRALMMNSSYPLLKLSGS
ncbi:MAG: type II secretion system protein N [Sulfuricaulis sp.]|uniref:type II secretion system protein N n=1 Tax=Sulfuricaulis sp. TaxID=2003553 RepID=UPI0025E76BC1|nr:type II secretion system protein N [Sulfuricaulis sp.]MCR4347281.1 type II secretion system protein N [Sulfuricaulis sp.]